MIKPTNLLTPKQLQSIGYAHSLLIPAKYWHESTRQCFKDHESSKNKNFKRDENETFQQFIRMELNGPNAEGTSRFPFRKVAEIRFSIVRRREGWKEAGGNGKKQGDQRGELKKDRLIDKKRRKGQQVKGENREIKGTDTSTDRYLQQNADFQEGIKGIETLLSQFFQIPTTHDPQIRLYIDKKTNKIIDQKQQVEFQFTQKSPNKNDSKRKMRSVSTRPTFDFWELFNLGIEYQEKSKSTKSNAPKHTIFLFFIEADLMEEDRQIDGRATGDGVAFISFNKEDFQPVDIESYFATQQHPCYSLPILIHECLHTLGFDHCSAWKCLMNPITDEDYLLCPSCLRKFDSEITFAVTLKEWYSKLTVTLKQLRQKLSQKSGNKKCLKMFADLLFSKKEFLTISSGPSSSSSITKQQPKMNENLTPSMLEQYETISLFLNQEKKSQINHSMIY